MEALKCALVLTVALGSCFAQQPEQYDLLLQGGHVIDAKNKISAVRDVALKDGKIAAVQARIDPSKALKTVNVRGLYV
ncbi:MAG: amidohydrolase/deacetylase family metallohydrolase, partial [Acidobacteriota bacterium]|nr:amidohydrolase/deacetylase family metallohydrolase [Acidobacteriota bacterium]